jgi:predicted RNA binding protein YcfA (HicA-like mRNA interferase family)
MPRKVRQVISALKGKGFTEDRDGDHIFLIYETIEGRKTTIRTRVSHQPGGGDIGDNLLGKMAKQTKLSRRDFEQLVDCYLSREQYDSKIKEKET